METDEVREETIEQIPYCPACKSKCVKVERELSGCPGWTVKVWVCPTQKYPSCL